MKTATNNCVFIIVNLDLNAKFVVCKIEKNLNPASLLLVEDDVTSKRPNKFNSSPRPSPSMISNLDHINSIVEEVVAPPGKLKKEIG